MKKVKIFLNVVFAILLSICVISSIVSIIFACNYIISTEEHMKWLIPSLCFAFTFVTILFGINFRPKINYPKITKTFTYYRFDEQQGRWFFEKDKTYIREMTEEEKHEYKKYFITTVLLFILSVICSVTFFLSLPGFLFCNIIENEVIWILIFIISMLSSGGSFACAVYACYVLSCSFKKECSRNGFFKEKTEWGAYIVKQKKKEEIFIKQNPEIALIRELQKQSSAIEENNRTTNLLLLSSLLHNMQHR